MSAIDRGEIMHLAGRRERSPALANGAPVLLAHGEAGQRCGWEAFFTALDARRETIVQTQDGGLKTAPRGEAPSRPDHPSALAGFLRSAAATLAALRGRAP